MGLTNLLDPAAHRTQGNTFASLLKDMMKVEDEQPYVRDVLGEVWEGMQSLHASSGRTTHPLGSSLKPILGFYRDLSCRHDQLLTAFSAFFLLKRVG